MSVVTITPHHFLPRSITQLRVKEILEARCMKKPLPDDDYLLQLTIKEVEVIEDEKKRLLINTDLLFSTYDILCRDTTLINRSV